MENLKKTNVPGAVKFDLVIHWKVTDYCNLSCPGCNGQAKKMKTGYAPEKINLPALREFLDKLGKTVKFSFTGGEPFLIENAVDVFAEVTAGHYMTLVTNLTSPKVEEFAARIDPARAIFIKASAHMQQLKKRNLLSTFFRYVHLLQGKGFIVDTDEVAYPPLADKAEQYRRLFRDNGIEFKFLAYRGMWGGKKYPESYTAKELAAFNFPDLCAGSAVMHQRKDTLCNAGYNIIVAYSDGSIYPCFFLTNRLGNLYQDVKLSKDLIRCPLDYCDCPLSVYDPHLFERAVAETKVRVE